MVRDTKAMYHLLRPGLSTSAMLLEHAIERFPRATFTFRSRLAAQPAFHLYSPTWETGIHDENNIQTRVNLPGATTQNVGDSGTGESAEYAIRGRAKTGEAFKSKDPWSQWVLRK